MSVNVVAATQDSGQVNFVNRGLALAAALVLAAALAGAGLAHPWGYWPVLVLTLLALGGEFLLPHVWLLLIPALLPVADLTWIHGAILVTDSDILLLALALAAYLGRALRGAVLGAPYVKAVNFSPLALLLLALLILSYSIGLAKGFLPYAPLSEQLGGYHNRWNAPRVAKGFFLALILIPPLTWALRDMGAQAMERLMKGMVLGLLGVCLFGVYERLAFTGIANFSSDYRITASFWEMHVGGAALDGWLGFTLPFAVWAAWQQRQLPWQILGAVMCAVGGYVALVTFSRGLYGACLVLLIVILALRRPEAVAIGNARQSEEGGGAGSIRAAALEKPSPWLTLFMWGASLPLFGALWLAFHSGGYRAMLALVLLAVSGHALAASLRGLGAMGAAVALGVALPGAGLAWLLAGLIAKGAYLAYGMLFMACLGMLVLRHKQPSPLFSGLAVGLWGALLMAGVLVAGHWGGDAALMDFVKAGLILAVCVGIHAWLHRGPWQPAASIAVLALAVVMAAAASIAGGYYMGSRFSTSSQDLGTRERHWSDSIAALHGTEDWLLGRGIGRYPEEFYWLTIKYQGNGDALFGDSLAPGLYAFRQENGRDYLRLQAPRHPIDWGEYFRVMQAIPAQSGALTLTAQVRADHNANVYFEVCERHLIYAEGCNSAPAKVKGGGWQPVQLRLAGHENGGPFYAPRRLWFAMAVEGRGQIADVAHVSLKNAAGEELLRNGDFTDNGRLWFFSSDRDHLPWHIKSVFLNMLFDQGALGLLAFVSLCLAVAVRLLVRRAYWTPAPYFLAALISFIVVGLFDSLVDVPRLAVLFYLCCFALLIFRPERLGKTAAPQGLPRRL